MSIEFLIRFRNRNRRNGKGLWKSGNRSKESSGSTLCWMNLLYKAMEEKELNWNWNWNWNERRK